jgi:GNAT superfamily N-acetyltransferase
MSSGISQAAPTAGVRVATLADLQRLERLIDLSARRLGAGDYSDSEIDGALRGAFGVDTQLLRDGTYFVVEQGDELLGCGGWSRRRTLFGGDARADRDGAELDPRTDAAKIRAFFVHPAHARRGVGTLLLVACERAAAAAGFSRFELMATLTGVKLYSVRGYVAAAPIRYPIGPGQTIEFVPMTKQAAQV